MRGESKLELFGIGSSNYRHSRAGGNPFVTMPSTFVRAGLHQCEWIPAYAGMTGRAEHPTQNGFTLIELLVALLIFGMLASAGVALLSFSVRAQAATTTRLTAVANERRVSALLSADLAQIVPRVSRNLSGDSEAAFDGGKGEVMMSYVRAGWSNSGGAGRSGLQRVEWRLAGGRLERITRPIVDGATNAKPVVMMENVERAAVRFRLKGEWRDDWSATDPRALPRAVELTITRTRGALTIRKFLVGTGY